MVVLRSGRAPGSPCDVVHCHEVRSAPQIALTEMAALLEGCKASLRAKVEHGFFYIRRLCGYRKVRYRGLGKNENRLALLLGFVNLLRAESCLA